ncbi:MAG TPA: EAL domain-containing protein [Pyrinomonadaceae bacterium]|jgi:diguanylate cyclase (GGDEF)-like protein/PAS domain S-box-containing protein
MKTQNLTKFYMHIVTVIGFLCLGTAFYQVLPIQKINYEFLFFAFITIGLGSRISVQIPRFKSHITVSDTFIFLAILLFGGETAVLLAGLEAFVSAWRFCNKKITVFFNASVMAFSTSVVVAALHLLGLNTGEQINHGAISDFVIVLSAMALVQFSFNSGLSAVYGALKSEKPWWETWKTHYLWTSITYFVGALSAGVLTRLIHFIGFGVLIATIPVIVIVFLTYRMYLKNVEMSIRQAEQAERHSEILEKQSIALRESEERFRSAFNYAPIGIALVSPNGKWVKVNHALCQILGYTEEEFLAANFQAMLSPDDLGDTLIKINELLTGRILTCQLEQRYLHKNGKTVCTWWSVSAASDIKSENPNLIFQIQDITDKKRAEEKLRYDASHDALTGLPNRKFFMSRLESALEKKAADPLHKVSVLFIDLDRFKFVNDSLGHHTGDELLIKISERLRECVRPTDTVARLGGDEFTILVEAVSEDKEVISIAERIREKFNQPFNLSGNELYSSASIGILHASKKHLTSEDLMRDADTAMYQAKRGGKARHEVFDENMHEAAKEILQIETDLRRALEKNEFIVYYQPIYSLITGTIEGFEALARWMHPTLGDIPPTRFIALAEETGLIDVLGEQILQKACSQMVSIKNDFGDFSPLLLSVNLSCKQFAQPTLVNRIKSILDETGFPPTRLKLEITESVFFEHKEAAIEMLHRMRAIGIEINIDDFGTGYSNLSYLRQLPISALKIDRSFISSIEQNGGNTEIIQTILMLAKNLGLRVVAEGVETEIQLEELKKLKCGGAQGFLLAKPMAFEEIAEFLNKKSITNISEIHFEDVPVLSTIQ